MSTGWRGGSLDPFFARDDLYLLPIRAKKGPAKVSNS